jgi:hypothetical protein
MSDTPEYTCDCGHAAAEPNTCEECYKTFCDECFADHTVEHAVDSDGKLLEVTLFETLSWWCDSCGHLNTIKTIRQDPAEDLSEGELSVIKEKLGLENWDDIDLDSIDGTIINVPSQVLCDNCRVAFKAKFDLAPGDIPLDDADDEDDLTG